MTAPPEQAAIPCANHPGVAAGAVCGGCSRQFCGNCLTELMGQLLCAACKNARLAQMGAAGPIPTAPATVADHIVPAKNPPALFAYYLGVFSFIPCAGNVLGPAAIILGVIGLRAQRANPNLPGRGHAIAGIVLGSLTSLLYWGLVILFVATVIGDKSRP